MGYIGYQDLCDQKTKKYIDETFKDVDTTERDRLIDDFSKEIEAWTTRTLHPFLNISEELSKTGDERDRLLKPYLTRMVAILLMMRKTGNNGNIELKEELKEIKAEIHKMFKGRLPMPELPKTQDYLTDNRNTKRVSAFFGTPKF